MPPLELFNEDAVKAYEKHIMNELAALGVDTSIPNKLNTDFEGKVVVVGDHPDKDTIEKAFEGDMDLRNGFIQSANHFLFKELAALHDQWAQKVEAGVSEEAANLWLISAAKNATSNSSSGMTLENGHFTDPFGGKSSASANAMKAYQG
jgi:hypothetical protein